MYSDDVALARPFARKPDLLCTELEAQLLEAVADFGVDELYQMLDVATALRRARRL